MTSLCAPTGETIDAKQRRLNLIKAVEGDDWSSVIDGQTQETMPDPAAATAAAQSASSSNSSNPSAADSADGIIGSLAEDVSVVESQPGSVESSSVGGDDVIMSPFSRSSVSSSIGTPPPPPPPPFFPELLVRWPSLCGTLECWSSSVQAWNA